MGDRCLRVWKAAFLAVILLHMSFEGTSALTTARPTLAPSSLSNSTGSANENNSTSVTPPPNDDGGGGCRGRGSLPCPAIIGIIVGGVVFIIIVVIIIVIVIRLLTKKSIGIETAPNGTSEYGSHLQNAGEIKAPKASYPAVHNQMPDFPEVADRRSKLPPLALSKEPAISHHDQWGRRDLPNYQDDGRPARALPPLTPSTSFNAADADVSEMQRRRKLHRSENDGEF